MPSSRLLADHVVLSAGARPATAFAAAAGLPLGATGGVRVDDHQRCPDHDGVYAAGDCAESRHRLLPDPVNVQLGTHANKQGRVAGTTATGGDVSFPGEIGAAVSRICRYEVGAHGAERASGGRRWATRRRRERRGPHASRLLPRRPSELGQARRFDANSGRLLGGQIIGVEGAAKRIDVLAAGVWSEMTTGELEMLDLGYAPPYSGVYDPLLIVARQTAKRVLETAGVDGARPAPVPVDAGAAPPG